MLARTILNVDDYAPGRYARTKVLTQAGFEVKEAATGREALRLATEWRPQLVVLDVNLPDINGLEVCQRLKENPLTSAIVVLHLTASRVLPDDMVRGLNSGADSYLSEPVEPGVLVATIRALLRARQAEEALRRSNDELQHFAYMVSHELNEPLRMITAYTQLLARKYAGHIDATADEYIDHTLKNASRLHGFVQDVLNFSRATAPERNFETVSMESVLATALYELQIQITESGTLITNDPMPVVFGNEMRLVRVFTNLIGNAIKYRGEEAPKIHIGVEEQDDFWLFSFRDNGIGIEKQYWDSIFQVFKRLHGKDVPGSGIGLALCKRVIENHGGSIWLESELGQGSTFFFTIPAGR
ncbi:MAG: ATP-binding protein [Bryobacteraceae bacterium]|jgi:signal transduction histidine kinase